MKARFLLIILSAISFASLGCALPFMGQSNQPVQLTPPFDYATITDSPDTVYYGESCGDDQPIEFTVKAPFVTGTVPPDGVNLKWAYVLRDGTVTQWAQAPMRVGSEAGVYQATITLEASAVNAVMNGSDGDITYEVEALYGRPNPSSTYGFGGELIRLEFCGDE